MANINVFLLALDFTHVGFFSFEVVELPLLPHQQQGLIAPLLIAQLFLKFFVLGGEDQIVLLDVGALPLEAVTAQEKVAPVDHCVVFEVVEVEKYASLFVGGVVQHRYGLVEHVGLPLQQVDHGVAAELAVAALQDEHLQLEGRVVGADVELGGEVGITDAVVDFAVGAQQDGVFVLFDNYVCLPLLEAQHNLPEDEYNLKH